MTEKWFTVATAPFEAARQVDILPEGHRSRGLHGHSFLARARVTGLATEVANSRLQADVLRHKLESGVSLLDYSLLNDQIDVPTDENLARWIKRRLNQEGVDSVGVQSTSTQGVDLDASGHAHLWRRFRFEAAHQLPHVPSGHKCGRMHGHGFEVIIHADQDVANVDMGVDFDYLGECWKPLAAQLHHSCLNDIPGLDNPTSEMIAAWIWNQVEPALPQLSWVSVYETTTAGCHYRPDEYRIWKDQTFEAAVRCSGIPESDPRHHLHGHSYVTRLHLQAPLDDVMGWTVDYGDVKQLFAPLYRQLDHHRLDRLNSLSNPDAQGILQWIRDGLRDRLPQLNRLDLYETPGCGGILCWGEATPALPA